MQGITSYNPYAPGNLGVSVREFKLNCCLQPQSATAKGMERTEHVIDISCVCVHASVAAYDREQCVIVERSVLGFPMQ